MNFSEYQTKARITAIYPKGLSIIYPTLGLCGESGEVAEKVKKYFRDNTDLDSLKFQVRKELGDVLWYISNIASDLNISLDDVAITNIDKLKDRVDRNMLHGSGDNR
jgi:NTP pyrophosphatase (non-canonical NTP hydrolase)